MDKKLIIAATMMLIATFLFGTIYKPDNPLMLFAGNGTIFTVIRSVSLIALGILLVTNPPRKLWVRHVIGGAAILTLTLAIDMVFSYMLPIADAVLMVQASIILGIEALEIQPKPVRLAEHRTTSAQ
jgi:hypothetical protein